MQQYRAYIKDCFYLNGLPKAWVTVLSFDINEDLLSKATSVFTLLDLPEDVDVGDIFVLYDPYGRKIYKGIIESLGDKEVTTTQFQSFYHGLWVYNNKDGMSSLEQEIAELTTDYAYGYTYGETTYYDALMRLEKAPVLVTYAPSHTDIRLTETADNYTRDYEDFIYSLYNDYGIVFEFDIPEYSWSIGDNNGGKVLIFAPEYDSMTIGNNVHYVWNVVPTTSIYDNNKLIIYDSKGVYRTTRYSTATGEITDDSSSTSRLKKINTNIVYSDDEVDNLVNQNLMTDMYSHRVEFSMLLDNYGYNWYDWKLGTPLDVWYNGHYFNTVYTAYNLKKELNKEPTHVTVVCGKVRTTLTKRLAYNGVL